MSKHQQTIILTGGGTGGHVTPILSLAHELKAKSPARLVYVGHKGDKFKNFDTSDLDSIEHIRAGKFRRYHGESLLSHLIDLKTLLLNTRDLFLAVAAIFKSLLLLKKYNPSVVFSKGGFVALPVAIAARFLGIPIVTHDSDAMPGLTNRIAGRWAVICATGMPSGVYPYPKSKIRYVGVPISSKIKVSNHSEQKVFKKVLGVKSDDEILFVTGGGNGSRRLNELLLASASSLLKSRKNLFIINLAGKLHAKSLEQEYKKLAGVADRVRVLSFSEDVYKLIGAADLIVSRAGATYVNEFAAAAKACIIIPSPFLTGGHQLKNADVLSAHDAALVLPNDITSNSFTDHVAKLLDDPARRRELAGNLHKLAKTDAASQLAKIVLEVAKERGA